MAPTLHTNENIESHMSGMGDMDTSNHCSSSGRGSNGSDSIDPHSVGSIDPQSIGSDGTKQSSISKYHEEFFTLEPCLYSHRVFEAAAQVFKYLSLGTGTAKKDDSITLEHARLKEHANTDAIMRDTTELEKRLAFELSFITLKYQSLLEFILDDCVFFSTNPQFQEDVSLVMVIFCDFQYRKFQRRTPFYDEVVNPLCVEIEESLYENKTKLNASLARNRIKNQAVTIEHLLPEELRDKEEESSRMPLSAWVNRLKTTLPIVEKMLNGGGFSKVTPRAEFDDDLAYFVDIHCHDLLIFSPMCRSIMSTHDLVQDGLLVLQDKSSSIGAHSVAKLVSSGDDIIHVNAGIGITTAHIASLLDKNCRIFAFGPTMEPDFGNTLERLHSLSATNVKLLREDFAFVTNDDARFKHCKVVLVTAMCSKTAINNPIDFIVNEAEDINILRDLSFGTIDNKKLTRLATKQTDTLKHALSLSKIQAVVYQTRSINEVENDIVCEKAIAYVNTTNYKKIPYRLIPPVLAFQPSDIEHKRTVDGMYIKLKATDTYSGSFLAVIAREPEEAKETAKQILEKAEAKGLYVSTKSKGDLYLDSSQCVVDDIEEIKTEEPEDVIKQVLREYAMLGSNAGFVMKTSSVGTKRGLSKKHTKKSRKGSKGTSTPNRSRRSSRSGSSSRRQSVTSEKKQTPKVPTAIEYMKQIEQANKKYKAAKGGDTRGQSKTVKLNSPSPRHSSILDHTPTDITSQRKRFVAPFDASTDLNSISKQDGDKYTGQTLQTTMKGAKSASESVSTTLRLSTQKKSSKTMYSSSANELDRDVETITQALQSRSDGTPMTQREIFDDSMTSEDIDRITQVMMQTLMDGRIDRSSIPFDAKTCHEVYAIKDETGTLIQQGSPTHQQPVQNYSIRRPTSAGYVREIEQTQGVITEGKQPAKPSIAWEDNSGLKSEYVKQLVQDNRRPSVLAQYQDGYVSDGSDYMSLEDKRRASTIVKEHDEYTKELYFRRASMAVTQPIGYEQKSETIPVQDHRRISMTVPPRSPDSIPIRDNSRMRRPSSAETYRTGSDVMTPTEMTRRGSNIGERRSSTKHGAFTEDYTIYSEQMKIHSGPSNEVVSRRQSIANQRRLSRAMSPRMGETSARQDLEIARDYASERRYSAVTIPQRTALDTAWADKDSEMSRNYTSHRSHSITTASLRTTADVPSTTEHLELETLGDHAIQRRVSMATKTPCKSVSIVAPAGKDPDSQKVIYMTHQVHDSGYIQQPKIHYEQAQSESRDYRRQEAIYSQQTVSRDISSPANVDPQRGEKAQLAMLGVQEKSATKTVSIKSQETVMGTPSEYDTQKLIEQARQNVIYHVPATASMHRTQRKLQEIEQSIQAESARNDYEKIKTAAQTQINTTLQGMQERRPSKNYETQKTIGDPQQLVPSELPINTENVKQARMAQVKAALLTKIKGMSSGSDSEKEAMMEKASRLLQRMVAGADNETHAFLQPQDKLHGMVTSAEYITRTSLSRAQVLLQNVQSLSVSNHNDKLEAITTAQNLLQNVESILTCSDNEKRKTIAETRALIRNIEGMPASSESVKRKNVAEAHAFLQTVDSISGSIDKEKRKTVEQVRTLLQNLQDMSAGNDNEKQTIISQTHALIKNIRAISTSGDKLKQVTTSQAEGLVQNIQSMATCNEKQRAMEQVENILRNIQGVPSQPKMLHGKVSPDLQTVIDSGATISDGEKQQMLAEQYMISIQKTKPTAVSGPKNFTPWQNDVAKQGQQTRVGTSSREYQQGGVTHEKFVLVQPQQVAATISRSKGHDRSQTAMMYGTSESISNKDMAVYGQYRTQSERAAMSGVPSVSGGAIEHPRITGKRVLLPSDTDQGELSSYESETASSGSQSHRRMSGKRRMSHYGHEYYGSARRPSSAPPSKAYLRFKRMSEVVAHSVRMRGDNVSPRPVLQMKQVVMNKILDTRFNFKL